jgi:hypothetical protein
MDEAGRGQLTDVSVHGHILCHRWSTRSGAGGDENLKVVTPLSMPSSSRFLFTISGHDLPTAFADRRAQSELIHNWYTESLHNRTRVLSKALAWDEFVAMVSVFHLSLLHVGDESHIHDGVRATDISHRVSATLELPLIPPEQPLALKPNGRGRTP